MCRTQPRWSQRLTTHTGGDHAKSVRERIVDPGSELARRRKSQTRAYREPQRNHYYFNFSGLSQLIPYAYNRGTDLLTGASIEGGQTLTLGPLNLAIVAEQ